MRIGCVSFVFASIIYLVQGLELPPPQVIARDRELSISFPGQHDGIDSIFFQAALIDVGCEVNSYAYISQSPWIAKVNLKQLIKSAKVRVQTLVESNRNITTQTLVYKIHDNGIGELVDDDSIYSFTSDDLDATEPPPAVEEDIQNKSAVGKLIFEDNFNNSQKLTDNWVHEVRYRNFAPIREFVVFVSDPTNSNITDNMLHITMTEGSERGSYLLKDCTGRKTNKNSVKECGSNRQKKHLIPITKRSANLYSRFTFKYGRVEIRARMPRGDWLFPNIFLEPNTTGENKDQIRLYARGNKVLQDKNLFYFDGRSVFGSVVVWNEMHNIWKPSEYWTARSNHTQWNHYWEDFHDYTIIWKPKKITFQVDGLQFGAITNETLLERFNSHESFIVLGLTAGGRVNFNDEVLEERHKPFSNTHPKAEDIFSEIFKTTKSTPLVIDHIRVYTH